MGAENSDRYGKDVLQVGTPYKPWQDQINGVHRGIHLGPTWDISVQEESDQRRENVQGEEENHSKLQGVQEGDVGVLPLSSHGEGTQNSPTT